MPSGISTCIQTHCEDVRATNLFAKVPRKGTLIAEPYASATLPSLSDSMGNVSPYFCTHSMKAARASEHAYMRAWERKQTEETGEDGLVATGKEQD